MRRTLLALAGLGAAGLGYAGGYEVRAFRLRHAAVPVLSAGARPRRLLHLSDVHLVPRQRRKAAFLRELAQLDPDLVINTGDSIAHPEAVSVVLDALGPLLDRPGAFVLGSNDYFAPRLKNPGRYLLPDRGRRRHGPPLPWPSLRAGLSAGGWLDLSNARGRLKVDDLDVEVVGVDDPHIFRDRYAAVAGPADPSADLHLGVSHSPEPRVLDRMAADGFRLLLAGHTHGGQLCLPGYGTIVTNCGLDRHRARGLSRYRNAWLHVSAGIGTSPCAPVRFACRPEATLLTLLPVG